MKKVLLCLQGQLEKTENKTDLLNILNYNKKFINYDNVLCHLWKSEHDQVLNQITKNNVDCIYDDDEMPFKKNYFPYITETDLKNLAESVKFTNGNNWSSDPFEVSLKRAFTTCKMNFALTRLFNSINYMDEFEYIIRSRYDTIFRKNLDLDTLKPYLDRPFPVIMVPKTITNYGLSDMFWVMNRPAISLFKNYINDCIRYSNEYKVFWSEPLFRFHLINIHKVHLYRFNFRCSLWSWNLHNPGDHIPEFMFNKITRDMKKFKHGEHLDSWFPT